MVDLIEIAAFVAAQLLGFVFLIAGLGKLFNPSASARSVEAYELLPSNIARGFGAILPLLELTLAVSLLTGRWQFVGIGLSLGLLLLFSGAQTLVLLRGKEVPCGCFGSLSSRPVRWSNVLSNAGLSCCCLLVAVPHLGDFVSLAPDSGDPLALGVTDVAQVRLLVYAACLQLLILKQILENRGHQQAHLRYERERAATMAIQRISPRPTLV